MSKSTSPFAGIKLSDQMARTSPAPDQRLFASSFFEPKATTEELTQSDPLAAVPNLPRPGQRERGKEGSREVGREGDLPRGREVAHDDSRFDINERPYRKASFLLTNEEFWALDEVKLDLHRRFELPATKDDLARCALKQLVSEYHRRGEESFLVRTLRRKRGK